VAGCLKYQRGNGEELTMGVLTHFLSNAKDAWAFTLDALGRFLERVSTPSEGRLEPIADGSVFALAEQDVPEPVAAIIGTYMEAARLLGQRTGELHLALASDADDRNFAPEAFTPFYQRSLFQSMRNLTVHSLYLLRRGMARIPEAVKPEAERVAGLEQEILRSLRTVHETRMTARRIRCHGDLHLGEILYTGKDFIFIDFEGDSTRPLGERRIKRSPLRDVASMIRSFDYISYAALSKQLEMGTIDEEHLPRLEAWIAFWHRWVSAAYLRAYLAVVGESDLLPRSKNEVRVLLNAHLLEKAVYEVDYEISNRPNWVKIPLRAILVLLEFWGSP
jgi:maltose alpha-D-glucosyltransferase/alpha-amylase